MTKPKQPKHRMVYEFVRERISSGQFGVGERIPTEAELTAHFDTSRVTVARAMRDLAREGWITRRRGAGSFVRRRQPAAGQLLGLITAETPGIFASIGDEITRAAQDHGYGLILGKWPLADADAIVRFTEELSRRYIALHVTGVFFTPMLMPPEQLAVNARIAEAFGQAGITVVLLDRDVVDFPRRSRFDLVGIDNFECGYRLTEHLSSLGRRRVHFLGPPLAASSVTARAAGWAHALAHRDIRPDAPWDHRFDGGQLEQVREVVRRHRPDGFVCANDHEASKLMRSLAALDLRIPEDVAIVGINDDPYAALLERPLTTFRQPCPDLGSVAVSVMLERLEDPGQAVREIRLTCELIVRESCGAGLGKPTPAI